MATKKETSVVGSLLIQKDPKTGELYIELPKDTLANLGWTEDDDLEWIENKDGTWQIKKVEKEE
jgi:hypothetical protein